MNRIYFLIINFLLFFNFFGLTNCDDPIYKIFEYSNLLPLVRVDLINNALKILPSRRSTDILKMSIEMNKLKESYEMNDAEGAFLVYQWIAKNINIKCYVKEEESSSASIFNSGKGDVYGISSLFETMVSHQHISSGMIEGYTRIYDNKTFIATQPANWAWNYIILNDSYYLVDASYGIGGCFENTVRFLDNIFFFGTKPEILINWDFPYDNKWQLLNEPVSFDKFKNNIHLQFYFYQFGYYSISPGNYTLEGGKEEIKITLYYNEIFPNCKRTAQYSYTNWITTYGTALREFTKISDGIFEANISTKDINYNVLRVFAHESCDYEYSVELAKYFINHTKINN